MNYPKGNDTPWRSRPRGYPWISVSMYGGEKKSILLTFFQINGNGEKEE